MTRKMGELKYMAVATARERLGVSPAEMHMLLEARALRCRKQQFGGAAEEVCAEDVRDAVEYLARRRQEENERRRRCFGTPEGEPTESRERSLFTLSDEDLMLLLLAAASYFDAERDVYFPASDGFLKCLTVVERIYLDLEGGIKEGRSVSEIVMEMYERRPDQKARSAVFTYLIGKASRTGERT